MKRVFKTCFAVGIPKQVPYGKLCPTLHPASRACNTTIDSTAKIRRKCSPAVTVDDCRYQMFYSLCEIAYRLAGAEVRAR